MTENRPKRGVEQELSDSSGVSRRGFLKGAGMMAGAVAFAPLMPPWELFDRWINPIKIGVLLPTSNIYPRLGESLTSSMRAYLDQVNHIAGDRSIKILTESIGFGPGLAVEKSRKLIERDRVDLAVGVVNSKIVADLRDIFEKSRTPLIVSNAGENVVTESERSPYIFYNSLEHWRTSLHMGKWAADNLGRKGFIATSLYDSGYDSLYAFHRGFELSGGQIVQIHTTHNPSDAVEMESLISAIEEANPDFVCGFYCGQSAVEFLSAYDESGLTRMIPLIGSGFMVEEDVLFEQGQAALGVRTGLTWSGDLVYSESKALATLYKERTGHRANAFSALGYDTARLISEALNAVNGNTYKARQMTEALRSVEFMGSRGPLKMDSRTQSSSTPIYLRGVRQYPTGATNEVIDELSRDLELERLFTSEASGYRTGWLNPYLFA